jgi:Excalibur calcium-binding domain
MLSARPLLGQAGVTGAHLPVRPRTARLTLCRSPSPSSSCSSSSSGEERAARACFSASERGRGRGPQARATSALLELASTLRGSRGRRGLSSLGTARRPHRPANLGTFAAANLRAGHGGRANRLTQIGDQHPHGVGKVNAHDRTKRGGDPVRTFRRSTRLHRTAISYNKRLDRDKDGIACEKA